MNEKVKAKIYELLPDLKEMKLGCRVRLKTRGDTGTILEKVNKAYVYWNWEAGGARILFEEEFEILGSPITLADVIRAMTTKEDKTILYCSTIPILVRNWDLTKNLDEQSKGVIKFIGKFLGV